MSDPTIKRALEVADQAMARVQGYVDESTSEATAAAIAAFLEALPVLRGDGPDGAVPVSLRPMAAAVRRAAGGGGDE